MITRDMMLRTVTTLKNATEEERKEYFLLLKEAFNLETGEEK